MFRRQSVCRGFTCAVAWILALLSIHSLAWSKTVQQTEAAASRNIQNGQFEEASEALEDALKQDPQTVELWNLLGIARTELHREQAAQRAFQQGLQLAPHSVSLNENIGFLFFREADYRTAKKYLREAMRLGSVNPGVRFSLAAAELRTGERVEALKMLKSLEAKLGNAGDYWVERGTAELPENTSDAEASFAHALQLQPDNLAALNGAASTAEKQGLDEKALAFLITARKSHPDDVPTLLHFGTVGLRRDLSLDALEAAKKAYELQPQNDYALYLLARANISQQNWQEAYDGFEQFAKRIPNYAPAYYALGWLDIKLNRTDQARQKLQRCLMLDSDLTDARAELAQLDLDNGELDKAQQMFEKALQQNPRSAKANTGMGDLLLRKGNLDGARHYLEEAIASDPKLGPAHYKLSQVLLRKHDTAGADRERALALRLNAEAKQASKTVLKLAMPDTGTLR